MNTPDNNADEMSKSRTVALQNRTWAKVDMVVASCYTGNRSAYFAELVAEDLARRGMEDERVAMQRLIEQLVAICGIEKVREKLSELQLETAEAAAPMQ